MLAHAARGLRRAGPPPLLRRGGRLPTHDSIKRAGRQTRSASVALARVYDRRLARVNLHDGLGPADGPRRALVAGPAGSIVHLRYCGYLRFGELHDAHASSPLYTPMGYYNPSLRFVKSFGLVSVTYTVGEFQSPMLCGPSAYVQTHAVRRGAIELRPYRADTSSCSVVCQQAESPHWAAQNGIGGKKRSKRKKIRVCIRKYACKRDVSLEIRVILCQSPCASLHFHPCLCIR